MRIKLIAIGTRMPKWVEQGYQDYAKRLNQEIQLELVEVSAGKRGKNADLERIKQKEGDATLSAIAASDWVIALDVKGKRLSTEKMAERLESLMGAGQHVSLLVGGPEGLANACLSRANEKWSLSDLTLPHPLVRIVIAEQLYRAWSIIKGHPYHR